VADKITIADIEVPRHVADAVQSWWNCDPKAVEMVKRDQTLSLVHTAVKVAFLAMARNPLPPADQSPIPALTKALKAYQAAAESWHDFHHGSTVVQCDAICALIPEGKAALALVEANHA
jgi:hypothetical protein